MRDEAEALARALEFGLCDIAVVIAWADAQILREDRPSEALCDVSLARGRYPQDVAGMLRQFPGTPDNSDVARLLLSLMKDRLDRDDDAAEPIAWALHQMAMAEEIDDQRLSDVFFWACEELELARLGYIQDPREQIVHRMTAALHEATTDPLANWSFAVVGEKPNPFQSTESKPPAQPDRPDRLLPRFLRILKSWASPG